MSGEMGPVAPYLPQAKRPSERVPQIPGSFDKCIAGIHTPDAGEILWNGQAQKVASPAAARALGISMVYQHFSLFDTLTAALSPVELSTAVLTDFTEDEPFPNIDLDIARGLIERLAPKGMAEERSAGGRRPCEDRRRLQGLRRR